MRGGDVGKTNACVAVDMLCAIFVGLAEGVALVYGARGGVLICRRAVVGAGALFEAGHIPAALRRKEAAVPTKVSPGRTLCFRAGVATTIAPVSATSLGVVAGAPVLAIGLANSMMFPTNFTLALEDLGKQTSNGSALLCMAIMGGAIVAVVYGAAADATGLGPALVVTAGCYLLIATFSLRVGSV